MKHLFASCAVIALMSAPAFAQSTFEPTDPLVESEQTLDPTMRNEADVPDQLGPETVTTPSETAEEAVEETVAETDPPADDTATDADEVRQAEAADDASATEAADPLFQTQTTAETQAFELPIDVAALPAEYSTNDLNAMMLAQLNVVATEIAAIYPITGNNVYAANSAETPGDTYAATETADARESRQYSETASGMVTAEGDSDQTAAEIAAGDDRFSTLTELVGIAGLDTALSGEGPYTVFAPTNDAFAALPAATIDRLKSEAGKAELIEILEAHVVEGTVMAGEVPLAGQSVETIGEETISVTGKSDGTLNVEGSSTIGDGIYASNGVVYAVDAVILPAATPSATSGR